MIKSCKVCQSTDVQILLDLGMQPVANRYDIVPYSNDYHHPLVLCQCRNCSLIQLSNPVPPHEIIPRVDWLKYNEPEKHLNDLADKICNLENLTEKPNAIGITYKDDSLLFRLKERLFEKNIRINPEIDLGIKQMGIAGETVIPMLNPKIIKNITNEYGYFDVVIARHVLEHALDTQFFLSTMWELIKPEGYIVFEVPDCTKQLENKDYTMPWEEHILYFVPNTLKSTFDYTSYELVEYFHYPYLKEDVHVVIIQKSKSQVQKKSTPIPEDFSLTSEYAEGFMIYRECIYSYIKHFFSNVGKIAFFGAGHDAVALINFLQIEEFIECIFDDTPQKQNLHLAGTSLKIKPSKELKFNDLSLCVLCMNIESQDKIIEKHIQFVKDGGIFASAYPNQKNSLINIAGIEIHE